MKKEELGQLILAVIVLAFVISVAKLGLENFLYSALFIIIIFAVSILAKKAVAYYHQCDVETKIWHFQRFGFRPKSQFSKPVPIGIILPFIIALVSLGKFFWLAATQTEITASKARVAKKHGIYRFSELTEYAEGQICGAGILALLVLSLVAYFAGFPELSKLSIIFASFNMIPLSKLDGAKIFFGSLVWWFILGILCLIGLSYVLFLV